MSWIFWILKSGKKYNKWECDKFSVRRFGISLTADELSSLNTAPKSFGMINDWFSFFLYFKVISRSFKNVLKMQAIFFPRIKSLLWSCFLTGRFCSGTWEKKGSKNNIVSAERNNKLSDYLCLIQISREVPSFHIQDLITVTAWDLSKYIMRIVFRDILLIHFMYHFFEYFKVKKKLHCCWVEIMND